jgi:hypothetical protein
MGAKRRKNNDYNLAQRRSEIRKDQLKPTILYPPLGKAACELPLYD